MRFFGCHFLTKTIENMRVNLEIELNELLYYVEAVVLEGEPTTNEYIGSGAEIDNYEVFDELGEDITRDLDITQIQAIEDRIYDHYNDII